MNITFKVWSRFSGEKKYSFEKQFDSESDAKNYILISIKNNYAEYQIQRVIHYFEDDEEVIRKKIIAQFKPIKR